MKRGAAARAGESCCSLSSWLVRVRPCVVRLAAPVHRCRTIRGHPPARRRPRVDRPHARSSARQGQAQQAFAEAKAATSVTSSTSRSRCASSSPQLTSDAETKFAEIRGLISSRRVRRRDPLEHRRPARPHRRRGAPSHRHRLRRARGRVRPVVPDHLPRRSRSGAARSPCCSATSKPRRRRSTGARSLWGMGGAARRDSGHVLRAAHRARRAPVRPRGARSDHRARSRSRCCSTCRSG